MKAVFQKWMVIVDGWRLGGVWRGVNLEQQVQSPEVRR